jgi:hypothetical protein
MKRQTRRLPHALSGSIRLPFLALLGFSVLSSTACDFGTETGEVQVRGRVNPPENILPEVQKFLAQAPAGTEVRFSQQHGYPLQILSLPAQLPEDRPPGEIPRPVPLEVSHGASAAGRASALVLFLNRNAELFGLPPADNNLDSELKISVDATNPELNENDQDPISPNLSGVFSTRVDQYISGVPVLGRSAIGQFDSSGNLYSVVLRLLPIDRSSVDTRPSYAGPELELRARDAFNELALSQRDSLKWLEGVSLSDPNTLSSVELVLLPQAEKPHAKLDLAYQLQVRRGIEEAVIYLNAHTGDLIRGISNTPSEWHNEASALVSATALDGAGVLQTFPACRRDNRLYMGFGSNYSVSGVRPFNSNTWLSVMDALEPIRDFRAPFQQMIPSSASSTFEASRGFSTSNRQLTSAMLTTQTTLNWWAQRGWRSWDGRGSHLGFFVNARPNPDGTPSLNAWGGGGYMASGGATVGAGGITLAGDLEVVGHEFMHNVVGATSALVYDYESGALNEALADLFGVALTANPTTDRLSDQILGSILRIRDMQDPTRSGQPDRYSAFVETEVDSRGVHINSGILNKAHWLMIQGGSFNGVNIRALGVRKVIHLLETVNRRGRLSATVGLEEFAATVIAQCRVAAVFTALLTGDTRTAMNDCNQVERAYRAVELVHLAERSDLAVESARTQGDAIILTVRNNSREDLNLLNYEWQLLEDGVDIDRTSIETRTGGATPDSARIIVVNPTLNLVPGTESFLVPGGIAEIHARVSSDILGESVVFATRNFSVRLNRLTGGSDFNTWNNQIPVQLSPDAIPYAGLPVSTDGGLTATLEAAHINPGASKLGPITSVLLTRNSATGPFSVIPGSEQTLASVVNTGTAGVYRFPSVRLSFGPNRPWTAPADIVFSDTTYQSREPYGIGFNEVWFDLTGGRPELEGRTQIYMLTDALDVIDEADEGNNLKCLNCLNAPWTTKPGLVVRFPRSTTNLEALFPERYRLAASKLRSFREGELREDVGTATRTTLRYRR